MAAEQPALTVLQLATAFPRIPGDVAAPQTYVAPPEILRIARATVARVVTDRPATLDLSPFDAAIARARGAVLTTSCGFLAPFQTRFAALTDRPFVASALAALPGLLRDHAPGDVLILTFDAGSLTPAHLGGQGGVDILGLPPGSHLRQVITGNLPDLDAGRAGSEIGDLLRARLRPHHRHILLECTNLPPYKPAIRAVTGLPVTDILTCIEAARPGTVAPAFL